MFLFKTLETTFMRSASLIADQDYAFLFFFLFIYLSITSSSFSSSSSSLRFLICVYLPLLYFFFISFSFSIFFLFFFFLSSLLFLKSTKVADGVRVFLPRPFLLVPHLRYCDILSCLNIPSARKCKFGFPSQYRISMSFH